MKTSAIALTFILIICSLVSSKSISDHHIPIIKPDNVIFRYENISKERDLTKKDENYGFRQVGNNSFTCENLSRNISAEMTSNRFSVYLTGDEKADIQYDFIGLNTNENTRPPYSEISSSLVDDKLQFESGKITLEYLNSKEGLRQNFIIHEKAQVENLLSVDLKITTDLFPVKSDNKITYLKEIAAGYVPVCEYFDLHVWDAKGKTLEAYLELKRDSENQNIFALSIIVDDKNAVYPIVVDPITTGVVDWTVSSYQASSNFGTSYNNAGDVNGDGYSDIIIGAYTYDNAYTNGGRAYIYHGSASGPALTPSQTIDGVGLNSYLGLLVNTAGDVNGDGFDDILIKTNYVVQLRYGSAGLILPGVNLTFGAGTDNIAYSFGPAGDVNNDGYGDVIAGCYQAENGNINEGKTIIWLGSTSGIVITPHRIYEGEQDNANLGYTNTAGDFNGDGFSDIATSAQYFDNGQTDEGIVYVYYGSALGLSEVAGFSREGNVTSGRAGYSLSAGDLNNDGFDELALEIPGYDDSVTSHEGLLEIYSGKLAGITSTDVYRHYYYSSSGSYFSYVNLTSDVNNDGYNDVVMGDIITDLMHPGAYSIFPGGPSGIINEKGFRYSGGYHTGGDYNNDGFADILGSGGTGIVQMVKGENFYLDPDLTHFVAGAQSGEQFGYNVGSAGDVNNDGYEDVIIGSPNWDGLFIDEGKVSVYLGNGGGTFDTPIWEHFGGQAGAKFGFAVSEAGDVNNDGFDDILIGSPFYDNTGVDEGRIQIFYGASTGISDLLISADRYSIQSNSQLGYSVSAAGDVNNDGYADVICGAPYFDKGSIDEGVAYVYKGTEFGLSASPIWTGESNQASAYFGYSVSGGGDVNGDGFDDVAAGAPFFNKVTANNGQAYVFHGKTTGVSLFANYSKTITGVTYMGQCVDISGDIDFDGYADLLISSNQSFYMYKGASTGISNSSTWSGSGVGYCAQSTSHRKISHIGDIDGDGYGDIALSSAESAQGSYTEGICYILHGNAFGITTGYSNIFEGNRTFAYLGNDIDAGDFNGDGLSDCIIGAPQYRDLITDNLLGRTYFYFGVESSCEAVSGLTATATEISANISWSPDPTTLWFDFRWRYTGDTSWIYDSVVTTSFTISGLNPCESLEYQVQAICLGGGSDWSPLNTITTDCALPCASAPTGTFVTDITSSSAKIQWDVIPDATKYKVWYRPFGTATWLKKSASTNFKTITGLTAGTLYELKVQGICGVVSGPFTSIMTFTTLMRIEGDNENDGLSVFPNPVSETIFLENNQGIQINDIYLIEITGKIILSVQPAENEILYQINLPKSLPTGIYYLMIMTNSSNMYLPFIKN